MEQLFSNVYGFEERNLKKEKAFESPSCHPENEDADTQFITQSLLYLLHRDTSDIQVLFRKKQPMCYRRDSNILKEENSCKAMVPPLSIAFHFSAAVRTEQMLCFDTREQIFFSSHQTMIKIT